MLHNLGGGKRPIGLLLSVLLASSLLISSPATALTGQTAPAAPSAAGVLQPLYLNNGFGRDAETQRVFSWETTTDYSNATVDIVAGGMPFKPENIRTFTGTTAKVPLAAGVTARNEQHVTVTGLEPGQSYDYRLGDTTTSAGSVSRYYSATYHFTTEPSAAEPFTFIHFADSQGDTSSYTKYWGNTVSKALTKLPDAAFIIDTGDMTDPHAPAQIDATAIAHWDAFFNAVGAGFSGPAFLPVLGNHEGSAASPVSFYQSVFPVGSQEGCPVSGYPLNYAYTYGNALFLELNSNYTSGADLTKQIAWIRSVAAGVGAGKVIIAAFHKGPYGELHSGDADVAAIKNSLVPVLEEVGVSLVLQGHDHQYYRSFPIKGGKPNTSVAGNLICTATDGAVFMCTGTSGQKTHAMYKKAWISKYWDPTTQGGNATQDTYSAITVDGDRISVNVYNTGDQLVDSYTILASANKNGARAGDIPGEVVIGPRPSIAARNPA